MVATTMQSIILLLSLSTVQPSIVVPPANRDLAPGSSSFLQCLAVGAPPPSSRWTRTNFITGATESLDVIGPSYFQLSSGLQLENVGRNESGSYECTVENVFGQTSSSAMVRVEGESPFLSLKPGLQNIICIAL